MRLKPIFPKRFNSKDIDFYKKRPDLAPRNVYLREGRIMNQEEVEKSVKRISNDSGRQKFWKDLRFRIVEYYKQLFRID